MASLENQEGTHVMKMITFSNKNSILFHSNLNIKIPLGRMKILSITMMLELLFNMKLNNRYKYLAKKHWNLISFRAKEILDAMLLIYYTEQKAVTKKEFRILTFQKT